MQDRRPFKAYCVKQSDYYKLILVFEEGTEIKGDDGPISINPFIVNPENREKVLKAITTTLGYWHGVCNTNGLKIKELELILPPLADYYFFESPLRTVALHEYNANLIITVGLQISADSLEDYVVDFGAIRKLMETNSSLN